MTEGMSGPGWRSEDFAGARRPVAEASHAPGVLYASPDVYRLEVERLFRRDWLLVGREEELPEPGDYMTLRIADDPIIVARARNGALHAFYNLRDGKYRGIGIACFTEVSGTGAPGFRARGLKRIPGFDSALLKIEPTGAVTCVLSTAGAGQGHETTFTQLIADELGVPMSVVTVLEGDTAGGPYGSGTFASRSVVTGGGAIVRAGAKLRQKMARLAAHLLEAAPEDIVFADGHASVRGMSTTRVTLREIAENAYSMSSKGLPPGEDYGLEATDYYDPPLVTMANATHVAAVAVDPRTGRIDIERYVVVHDCGRVINPMIVEGQIHGGAAQGIGQVVLEAMVYDADGQCRSATFMDYLLPTAVDVPAMTVDHIESPSIDAAGGFKGIGEGGVIGAVPALTNAVADALAGLGANVNHTPLTPDRVLALIEGEAGA